jgi:hypothetical protein
MRDYVMASEPNGEGFISPAVLRPVTLSHKEVSRRGGKSKSAAKREASLRNLEKAKAVRESIGARPWHKAERMVQAITRPCGPGSPT